MAVHVLELLFELAGLLCAGSHLAGSFLLELIQMVLHLLDSHLQLCSLLLQSVILQLVMSEFGLVVCQYSSHFLLLLVLFFSQLTIDILDQFTSHLELSDVLDSLGVNIVPFLDNWLRGNVLFVGKLLASFSELIACLDQLHLEIGTVFEQLVELNSAGSYLLVQSSDLSFEVTVLRQSIVLICCFSSFVLLLLEPTSTLLQTRNLLLKFCSQFLLLLELFSYLSDIRVRGFERLHLWLLPLQALVLYPRRSQIQLDFGQQFLQLIPFFGDFC